MFAISDKSLIINGHTCYY